MRDTGTFPISANAFARKIKRGGSVSAICWRWNCLGRVGLGMGFFSGRSHGGLTFLEYGPADCVAPSAERYA